MEGAVHEILAGPAVNDEFGEAGELLGDVMHIRQYVEGLLSQNREVRSDAAVRIADISGHPPDVKESIIKAGGIPALFRVIIDDCDATRSAVCRALFNLTVCENAKGIILVGFLDLLLDVVRTAVSHEVLWCALGALANIATLADGKEVIARRDGIPSLIRHARYGNQEMQRQAARGLFALSAGGDTVKGLIVENDGLPVLLGCLNSSNSHVQWHACGALANLIMYSAHQETFCALGGVQNVILLLSDQSSRVRNQAARALFALSANRKYRVLIGQSGALEPLLRMISRPSEESGHRNAMGALANLAIADENKMSIVFKLNGLKASLELIASEKVDVLKELCRFIFTLSANVSIRHLIAASGGVRDVVSVLRRHSDNGDILRDCAGFLANTSLTVQLRQYLFECDAVSDLMGLVSSSDDQVLRQSVRALFALTEDTRVRRAFEHERSAIRCLFRTALRPMNAQTRNQALGALAHLALNTNLHGFLVHNGFTPLMLEADSHSSLDDVRMALREGLRALLAELPWSPQHWGDEKFHLAPAQCRCGSLKDLLITGVTHDLVLKVTDFVFRVHRSIIYFKASNARDVFCDWKEIKKPGSIPLLVAPSGYSAEMLRMVLEIIYTGRSFDCDQMTPEVLAEAKRWGVKPRRKQRHDGRRSDTASWLKHMADDVTLSDIRIIAKSDTASVVIPCHRAVLAAHSQYFASLFQFNATLDSVNVDYSETTMRLVMLYIYSGRFPARLGTAVMVDILIAADALLMPRLRRTMEARLIEGLNNRNAVAMLLVGDVYSCHSLFLSALDCLVRRYETIAEDAWHGVPPRLMAVVASARERWRYDPEHPPGLNSIQQIREATRVPMDISEDGSQGRSAPGRSGCNIL